MYDVKEFHFNQQECWFRSKCKDYDTQDCHCGCPLYCQYYYLVNLANIPTELQQPENQVIFAMEDIKKYEYLNSIKQDIYNWVQEGNNLYIYSPHFGNGKTTWSIKLMSKYFTEIVYGNGTRCRGLFVNVDDFLMSNKKNIGKPNKRFQEIMELIPEVDLVVWDDIGCTRLSDFDHQTLYPLLNSRIAHGKSNIFTSNVIDEDLINSIGQRLASRVLETSQVVEFTNPPQRTPRRDRI